MKHPNMKQAKILYRIAITALIAFAISACQSNSGQTGQAAQTQRPDWRSAQQISPLSSIPTNANYTAQEVNWFDSKRQRSIPAVLYLPKTDQPAPLIVFSHGLGGTRYGYSGFGKYWASKGMASIHLQHPGSDRAVWTSQGFAVLSALKAAANTDNAVARALDVTFALNTLAADTDLAKRINFEKIGVGGHSFGANTALMSAGAQFQQDGKALGFGDKRIKAALVMSPPALPTSLDPKYVYRPIQIPTLHLTGTQDNTPIPGAITTADMRRESYDAIPAGPKYLGIYDGGKHAMFNDRTRDDVNSAIKQSAYELSLKFFNSVFNAAEQSAGDLRDNSRAKLDKEHLFSWEASN